MFLKFVFDRLAALFGLLLLWPVILVTAILVKIKMPGGPATLKYRVEDEMIAEYVAKRQAEGDTRPMQVIATEYNDTVIYPDKVRLNCYYYRNYSFIKNIQMIFATVLGWKIEYAGETI